MRARPERFHPRRRWGQNFLVNRGAIEAILAAFRPGPDDLVLEIGPGRGALTRGLLGRVARIAAVEIDPALVAELRGDAGSPGLERASAAGPGTPGSGGAHASGPGGLEIIEADILEVDLAALLARLGATPARPARVIANLPYNIATPILLRLLGQRALLRDLLVMVQREVAERIASPPGRKTYGGLSVLCQAGARVEKVLRLRPGSFRPRPRVESEVLRLVPLGPGGAAGGDPGGAAAGDPGALAELLRVAFEQRRKTLLNNLARLPGCGPAGAERLIRAAGLDPDARPEHVPVAGFLALVEAWKRRVGRRDD